MRPVAWARAASEFSMIIVRKTSASGRYFASKVRMKKETWRVGLSWAYVYA